MIKANCNQMWRSEYVAKDEPYPQEMSDKEMRRLIRAGLAYQEAEPDPKPSTEEE